MIVKYQGKNWFLFGTLQFIQNHLKILNRPEPCNLSIEIDDNGGIFLTKLFLPAHAKAELEGFEIDGVRPRFSQSKENGIYDGWYVEGIRHRVPIPNGSWKATLHTLHSEQNTVRGYPRNRFDDPTIRQLLIENDRIIDLQKTYQFCLPEVKKEIAVWATGTLQDEHLLLSTIYEDNEWVDLYISSKRDAVMCRMKYNEMQMSPLIN